MYTLLFFLKCSFVVVVVVGGTTGARGSINRDVKEERGGLIGEEDLIKWVKMAIIVSWISIVLTLAFGIAGLFIAITGKWHLSHHSKHIQMTCFCPHIICSSSPHLLDFSQRCVQQLIVLFHETIDKSVGIFGFALENILDVITSFLILWRFNGLNPFREPTVYLNDPVSNLVMS